MRMKLVAAIAAAAVALPVALPVPAAAQHRDRDYRWQGDRQGWDASNSASRVTIASIAGATGAIIAAATTAPPGW